MNVTLPDGTTVENVPDGTSQKDLVAKLSRNGIDTSWYKEAAPESLPKSKKLAYALSENPGIVEEFLGGVKHAWDKGSAALQKGAGKLGLPTGDDLTPLVEQGKEFVEKTGAASTVGDITGEIGLTAFPAAKAYKVVSAIPGTVNRLRKAVNLAGGGAAAGATAETMMGRDPVQGATVGAIAAPVMTVAGKGLNKVIEQGQKIYHGASGAATDTLREMFGGRTQAAINALRSTQPIVQGERVTAGLAANQNLPELAVLEAGARSRPNAHLFTQADEATSKARTKALDDIANPGERPINPTTGKYDESTVESLRSGATRPLYQSAMPDQVPVSPELEALMRGPEVGGAVRAGMNEFRQAVQNARAEGRPIPKGGQWSPNEARYTHLSVDQLQRVLKQLNERIRVDPSDYNLIDARNQISRAMKGASSDFDSAQTLFREMSKPQNRADVARTLEQKMNAPANDVSQRAGAYASALREAPSLFKKADLTQRFQTIDEVFQGAPNELKTIRDVGRSLERERTYDLLPKNKGIVPEFLSPFDKAERLSPHTMARAMTIFRSIMKTVGRKSDRDVQEIIDRAASDPNALANLIEAVPPAQRNAFMNKVRAEADKVVGATVGPVSSQLQRLE